MKQEELDKYFLQKTIDLAIKNIHEGKGGPFAALIVKDNQIVAEGTNLVTSANDPTAHAEITAIRKACEQFGHFQLEGCTIYSSCEPCPMCLGAIYWARPQRLVFAANKKQAAAVDFDDDFIYQEIVLDYDKRHLDTQHIEIAEANKPFEQWQTLSDKIEY